MKTPTYGLIGRGRVATHMAHYLDLEDSSRHLNGTADVDG